MTTTIVLTKSSPTITITITTITATTTAAASTGTTTFPAILLYHAATMIMICSCYFFNLKMVHHKEVMDSAIFDCIVHFGEKSLPCIPF